MVVGNAPEDIARRKIEEALQYGDPMIEHEGSVATLRLSTKYHKAPPREQEGNLPKPPGVPSSPVLLCPPLCACTRDSRAVIEVRHGMQSTIPSRGP